MGTKFSSRDIKITIKSKILNRTFENLHFKLVATKTLSGSANTGVIEMYNLNSASRQELSKNVYDFKDNKSLTLVTFELDGNVLFEGDLININHMQENNQSEYLSTLYCGDGLNALLFSATQAFKKGMTPEEMIEQGLDLLKEELGIVKGFISDSKPCTKKSLAKELIYKGDIVANIKRLLKMCLGGTTDTTDVYVEEGKVNMLDKNKAIKNYKQILNKNLLEAPTLNEQGVSCKVRINPLLKTGAEMEIKTKNFNVAFSNLTINKARKKAIDGTGIYKITSIVHTVDNFSNDVATSDITGVILGLE